MILTPIAPPDLPRVLDSFARGIADDALAAAVFDRIAATLPLCRDDFALSTDAEHLGQAVALAEAFGIPTLAEPPQDAYSWDGHAIRTISEPSVVIHEVAHYQACAPERRSLPDFGLGAGPETGRRAEADAAARLFDSDRDLEEGLTSLLGIVWEAELDQPALAAFLEQNWLEGGASPGNLGHFRRMVAALALYGFIDDAGRPLLTLRATDDARFFADLAALGYCPTCAATATASTSTRSRPVFLAR